MSACEHLPLVEGQRADRRRHPLDLQSLQDLLRSADASGSAAGPAAPRDEQPHRRRHSLRTIRNIHEASAPVARRVPIFR